MKEKIEQDERRGLPSASSMDANIHCSGRLAMVNRYGSTTPSEDTERGERIHSVLEKKLDVETLSDSEKMLYADIVNEENALVEKLGMQDAQVLREKRFFATDEELSPVYSGRLDVIYIKDRKALVIDYKTGFSRVQNVSENWQMRTQAVLTAMHFDLDQVVVALIHPNHPDSISEFVKFSRAEISLFEKKLLGYVREMTKDAERTPNSISCMYCPARERGICKEYKSYMRSLEKDKTDLEQLTPEERGDRIREIKLLQDYCDNFLDRVKESLAKDPSFVVGWKLRQSTMRVVVDHTTAASIVKHHFGDEAKESCVKMRFSLEDLEKWLSQNRNLKKLDAEIEALRVLDKVIVRKKKSPSLIEDVKNKKDEN